MIAADGKPSREENSRTGTKFTATLIGAGAGTSGATTTAGSGARAVQHSVCAN